MLIEMNTDLNKNLENWLESNVIYSQEEFKKTLETILHLAQKSRSQPRGLMNILLTYIQELYQFVKRRENKKENPFEIYFENVCEIFSNIFLIDLLVFDYETLLKFQSQWLRILKSISHSALQVALADPTHVLKNLVLLTAKSGDIRVQMNTLKVFLQEFARYVFDSVTISGITAIFKTIGFTQMEHMLYTFDSNRKFTEFRKIVNALNELKSTEHVLSIVANDIWINNHTLKLSPSPEIGFWIDFSRGSQTIRFLSTGDGFESPINVEFIIKRCMVKKADIKSMHDGVTLRLILLLTENPRIKTVHRQIVSYPCKDIEIDLIFSEVKSAEIIALLQNWFDRSFSVAQTSAYDSDTEQNSEFGRPSDQSAKKKSVSIIQQASTLTAASEESPTQNSMRKLRSRKSINYDEIESISDDFDFCGELRKEKSQRIQNQMQITHVDQLDITQSGPINVKAIVHTSPEELKKMCSNHQMINKTKNETTNEKNPRQTGKNAMQSKKTLSKTTTRKTQKKPTARVQRRRNATEHVLSDAIIKATLKSSRLKRKLRNQMNELTPLTAISIKTLSPRNLNCKNTEIISETDPIEIESKTAKVKTNDFWFVSKKNAEKYNEKHVSCDVFDYLKAEEPEKVVKYYAVTPNANQNLQKENNAKSHAKIADDIIRKDSSSENDDKGNDESNDYPEVSGAKENEPSDDSAIDKSDASTSDELSDKWKLIEKSHLELIARTRELISQIIQRKSDE